MSDGFAHRFRLDQIRDGERHDLVAAEDERRAIAKRLRLHSLERLEATIVLTRTGDVIRAQGRIIAAVEQSCVITSEPIPALIDEPIDLLFVPEAKASGADEEIELTGNDLEVVFYDGGGIDLGDAIADTLALGLDPYPRSAGADAALREAGVLTEAEASPFAALARLKKGSENSS